MAITIKQIEGVPANYPVMPVATSSSDRALLWARLESFIAHRWGERNVFWVVEGPGEWVPPLTPATINVVEVWSDRASTWETADLSPSPLGGYWLPCTGPYRFSGTVGDDAIVPPTVIEAFRRLAEYMAAKRGRHPGAISESVNIGEAISESYRRDPAWLAMAMQNSGAADLLRQFRRVG